TRRLITRRRVTARPVGVKAYAGAANTAAGNQAACDSDARRSGSGHDQKTKRSGRKCGRRSGVWQVKEGSQKVSGEAQPSLRGGEREPETEELSHPLHALHRSMGNEAVTRMLRQRVLRAKLRVSEPTDASEQEADRVADRVMSAAESPAAAHADAA